MGWNGEELDAGVNDALLKLDELPETKTITVSFVSEGYDDIVDKIEEID